MMAWWRSLLRCATVARMPGRRAEEHTPALCRCRDAPDAFDELYRALASRVASYFARRVRDEQLALDLACETFTVVFEQRHRFRGVTEEEQEVWLAYASTRFAITARASRRLVAAGAIPDDPHGRRSFTRVRVMASIVLLAASAYAAAVLMNTVS